MATDGLKAPFPWFGGKSRVAKTVWQRFGDVGNYVEPFAGSLAVLLGRPHWPWAVDGKHYETANDLDCYLTNAWRAMQAAPDEVAEHADWPVHEADLLARHMWINAEGKERVQRLRNDPDYYDAKVAGWWIWGMSLWIGQGWYGDDATKETEGSKPSMTGRGVDRKKPYMTGGVGVNRKKQGGVEPDAGEGACAKRRATITGYMRLLCDRLRLVRVCCGDWMRVLTPACTTGISRVSGVFLDPPYCGDDREDVYAHEDYGVAHDVFKWAVENGDDKRFRIALCGYEGEYAAFPDGWSKFEWKAVGGFGNQRKGEDKNENRKRERIWFSPHCLRDDQPLLFGMDAPEGTEEADGVVPARAKANSSPGPSFEFGENA